METIKVGTKVRYRGCFGMGQPEVVTVERIERSAEKRSKYGKEVASVPFAEREYCIFDLDNGHWCYGEQIDEIAKTIYIVVKEQVYDFESSPISVERYNNKEEAINDLKEDFEDYLDAYKLCGFVSEWNDTPENTEVNGVDFGKEIVSCEAYLDERWSQYHYVGKVVEFEV